MTNITGLSMYFMVYLADGRKTAVKIGVESRHKPIESDDMPKALAVFREHFRRKGYDVCRVSVITKDQFDAAIEAIKADNGDMWL